MDEQRIQQTLQLFGELQAERAALGLIDAETKRNVDNIDIFEAMIRAACDGVTFVAAGHHIMFMQTGYPIPGEVPSADALIFDHEVAKVVWGDRYRDILTKLALEPTETRDALLRQLYYTR
jgi:hypothetical protein